MVVWFVQMSLHHVSDIESGQDFRVSMGFGLHHGWAIEAPTV